MAESVFNEGIFNADVFNTDVEVLAPPPQQGGAGFGVRTASFPIRVPGLQYSVGAAEVLVEIPAARCVIDPTPTRVALRAGAAQLSVEMQTGRSVVVAAPVSTRLRAAGAQVGVDADRAGCLVTDAGDETLALRLLGLL